MRPQQENAWAGEFGNAYTERNRVDWWARVPFWSRMISATRPCSVVEVGCNAGWNLMAIRALNWVPTLRGVDVNQGAVLEARSAGLEVAVGSIDEVIAPADLIFTAGVLIHIAPDHVARFMEALAKKARRYVLAVEYEHGYEQEIEYRGERQMLWKRPYGQLYQGLGLQLIARGPAEGFDNCTAWLLKKP